jgi:hypothetical protein
VSFQSRQLASQALRASDPFGLEWIAFRDWPSQSAVVSLS